MTTDSDLTVIPPPESINGTDRHLTTNSAAFTEALKAIDLSGLTVLELGCGEGHLLRAIDALPEERKPDTIYAFEISHEDIADDIKAWAADENRKPRLIINPPEFKINPEIPDGDFTNYDFIRMLGDKEQGFAIVSNPPYFLWNRILSLTGEYIFGDNEYAVLKDKFKGALGITSERRLPNHPGWIVRAQLDKHDFTPVASTTNHYVIQNGFEGRYDPSRSHMPEKYRPKAPLDYQEGEGIIGVPEPRYPLTEREEEWGSGYASYNAEEVRRTWVEKVEAAASNDNRAIPKQRNPHEGSGPAPLIYLLGYPGTGKRTIAESICAATGAELCDSHRWNAEVFRKHGVNDENPPSKEALEEAGALRDTEIQRLGELPRRSFKGAVFTNKLYEDNLRSYDYFNKVSDLAEAQGVPLLTVRLLCDKEEILRRGANPSRAERKKLTSPEALKAEMENNTLYMPFHPNVVDMDVTHMPAEEAAARVMLLQRCMGLAERQGITLQELADKAAAYQPSDMDVNMASLDELEDGFRASLGERAEKGGFTGRVQRERRTVAPNFP